VTAIAYPWRIMGERDDSLREVESILENFLREQRQIEAKRAKEIAERDRESLRVHKESFGEIANRLLASFAEHEKKDDLRHGDLVRMHGELRGSFELLEDRVGHLESEKFRKGWKESPSGLHLIKDIDDARREEEMFRRLSSRGELKTWRYLKKHTAEIVIGVAILVIAGAIGAIVGTRIGEHAPTHESR
jgi:hypothetical protein